MSRDGKNRPWTKRELALLRKSYSKLPNKKVALLFPGRTKLGVGHWTQEAGVRGGKKLAPRHSQGSPSPGENAAATPLGGPRPPQKPQSGNGNGLGIRHDGLSCEPKPPKDAGKLRGQTLACGEYGTFYRTRAAKKGKKPLPAERVCAYHECGAKFAPKRPNQFYHSENCRKFAHQHRLRDTGDAAARLVSALEAVAAAPEQLGDLVFSREGVDGKSSPERAMWGKILQLADRADAALKFWKSHIDHRSPPAGRAGKK